MFCDSEDKTFLGKWLNTAKAFVVQNICAGNILKCILKTYYGSLLPSISGSPFFSVGKIAKKKTLISFLKNGKLTS